MTKLALEWVRTSDPVIRTQHATAGLWRPPPYAVWVRDALEVAFDQVRRHSGQAVQRQKRLYDQRAVRRLFAIGDWVMRYYPPAKKCKLDSVWVGPYLVMSLVGWLWAFRNIRTHPFY